MSMGSVTSSVSSSGGGESKMKRRMSKVINGAKALLKFGSKVMGGGALGGENISPGDADGRTAANNNNTSTAF